MTPDEQMQLKIADVRAFKAAKLFVRECGVSPMAFLNDARIDAARRILENTDQSMKEIAAHCGFETPEAMRRAFRRRLQLTPPEYRRRFHSGELWQSDKAVLDGGAEV